VRTTDRPAPCTLFDALYTKLCDVQRRTSQLSGHTLASIFLALEQLRDLTPDLQATFCHGDLTLENIIVDDRGRPWLVDFLDAPFEHWWQDVAKLHQDLDGGWYLLSQSPIARCVVDYLSKRVLAAAAARDPRYALVHSVMLACTFARILPYVRTPEELEFVRMRVEYFAEQARSP
jgi:aminoglycoside/choline kinase family phosphotransferase